MQMTDVRRHVVRVLWWLGLALIAASVGLLITRLPVPAAALAGSGAAFLGVNALLAGDISTGARPRSYAARGQVVRGTLQVHAGLSDLSVDTCPPDRVAQTVFGPFGKPDFSEQDGVARLRLNGSPFNIAAWYAGLASNVLWDIEASSLLGNLSFNLRGMRLERLEAHTALGRLYVNCGMRGYARLSLRTTLGEVEVHVPEGVGARVTVRQGELCALTVNNERLLALGPGRYSTPDFDAAQDQVEIEIESAAGDLILS